MREPRIVYDGGIRDNGTPFYFRAALAQVLGHAPEWCTQANPLPDDGRFSIMIDDGREDLTRLPSHPWGYYAIDTHLEWDNRYRKARKADIVWCAQKPAADRMKEAGLNAHWLPLACEPICHPAAEAYEPKFDLVFAGHMQDPSRSTRVDFLDALFKAHPNSWLAIGFFHQDMARFYHQGRIGVNHAIRDDLNMRFFEIASMGVPQLCDRRMVGLKDLGFIEGVDYIGYDSTEEALEQTGKALTGTWALEAMSKSALQKVRSAHTYQHRVEKMLSDIGGFNA